MRTQVLKIVLTLLIAGFVTPMQGQWRTSTNTQKQEEKPKRNANEPTDADLQNPS